MPLDMSGLLAAAAALFSLISLLVVLLRHHVVARDLVLEAAVERLHAAQERQTERLATLPVEIRAEVVARTGDVGEKLTAQVLDQTKALNSTLADQTRHQGEAATALRHDFSATAGALKEGVEAVKTTLAEGQLKAQQALTVEMTTARDLIDRKAKEARDDIEAKLKEMREANEAKLAEIQKTVNEQLHAAVEKQMTESFQRVIDQFDAVQRSMVEVQAVTGQIGDLKRLFSNVKARGGWGEAQCKSLLEDILPGGFVENFRPREDSAESVEFAVLMPSQRESPLHLPLDAKFPVEDYERLLAAAEAGESVAERDARRALGERVRRQAADIAAKYIQEPATTDFALLYLPSDSLYAEVARIPGLLAAIGRDHKVLIVGPSLLPAMLRTIQLGHYSLALSRNADAVRELLGATKSEVQKMAGVLTSLERQAGTFGTTIGKALTRTRAIDRKLRGVDAVTFERSEQLLELEVEPGDEAAEQP